MINQPVGLVDQSLEGYLLLEGVVILKPLQGGELSQTLQTKRRETVNITEGADITAVARQGSHLQDDVVESDEILRTGAPLVLVCPGLLQFSLQSVSHALIPLHQCAQLDVGQITGRKERKRSGENKEWWG